MGIFNSLRLTQFKPMSTGKPQVQPVSSYISNIRATTSRVTSVFSRAQPKPTEVPLLRITGLSRTKTSITRFKTPTLFSLADNLIKDKNFLIPSYASRFTTIRPAYKALVKPKGVYRDRASDDTAVDTRHFEPYERLTGISHERPEIILLSEFKPVFSQEAGRFQQYPYYNHLVDAGLKPYMTDVGHYIDTQINARNLKCANIIHMFRRLRYRNFHFYNVYRNRRAKMTNSMNDLNNAVWFLLNVVRQMDRLKGQLDLRDDIHKVIPQNVIRRMSLNFTKTRASWLYNFLQRLSSQFLPPEYDITDVLERLGYKKENTKVVFSSTKLWLQMLEEYKDILRDHSLEFLDVEAVSQRRDNNATVLNKKDIRTFSLKPEDPKGLSFLNEIVGFAPSNITSAQNTTSRAFSSIYNRSARFKSEEARIAALANIISKEFRYSRGLALDSVRRSLRDHFDYVVNDGPTSRSSGRATSFTRSGNLRVFDHVIGQFTNNIAEIPAISNNSLASLAQQRPTNDIAVLPFESKYLEGDTGTTTPGATYYVDEILNLRQLEFVGTATSRLRKLRQSTAAASGVVFNTQRLEQLAKQFGTAASSFATVVDGLNLYGVSEFDSQDRNPKSVASVMGNQSQFVERLVDTFVDNKGRTLPYVRRDRLTSVFALARKNKLLRSQLFLYYMNRIARSYAASDERSVIAPVIGDNTPFTDAMVKKIEKTILRSTRPSRLSLSVRQRNIRLASKGDSNDLTSSVIESSLRKGTKLSQQVEALMKQILEEFNNDQAISSSNDRTKYGGHMDTTIMMVVFDMIISIVARYGNQVITGRGISGFRSSIRGGRTTTYFVTQRNVNYRSAINDLVNRSKKEQALIQQITWCVLNSLGKLNDAIVGVVNNLNSSYSVARLRAISDVIDDDEELRQLMSEQQIMMLGSNVFDISARFFSNTNTINRSFDGDVDNDGDFDSDDTISIIDDSPVGPALRDAFYGFFNLAEMCGEKAANKKIITVGLPLGFSRRLEQKVKLAEQKKTSFTPKQNDIIEILVYKLDLLNQDIIFKPQKFLFELTRFPVRNESYILDVKDNPTFEDLAASVPTRDFEESFEEGNNSVAYFKTDSGDNTRIAMDADSYDFMEEDEKSDVIQNHITSYMCELYLKLLTGISTAEYTFDIDLEDEKDIRPVEEDFIKVITTHKMSEIASFTSFKNKGLSRPRRRLQTPKKSNKLSRPKKASKVTSKSVLFSSALTKTALSSISSFTKHIQAQLPRLTSFSGIAARVPVRTAYQAAKITAPQKKTSRELERSTLSLSNSMGAISHRQTYSAVHALRNIASFTRMKTSLSDGLHVQKDLLRPKQFDRVFNILVDPDDFEIDYDKTMETEFGKETFKQMIKRGDIAPGDIDKFSRAIRKRSRLLKLSKSKSRSRRISARADLARLDTNNFVIREKDRGEGDVSFEKYFIVVNTFGEEDI